jgi:hypothetical protein
MAHVSWTRRTKNFSNCRPRFINLEKIPQTAAAPRRYSASYFEYCDARGRPGSRACRGRHWRACSRMRGAACGMRLDPQIGRAGHPFDDTGEVSVSGRRKERGRSRLLTPPRRAVLLRPLRPHRQPIRVCLAASVISPLARTADDEKAVADARDRWRRRNRPFQLSVIGRKTRRLPPADDADAKIHPFLKH